ncbi:hypothetical protein [Kribbella lupini]
MPEMQVVSRVRQVPLVGEVRAPQLPTEERGAVQVQRVEQVQAGGAEAVQEMPLVGSSEPLERSPFVAALGGPAVQRMAAGAPVQETTGGSARVDTSGEPVGVRPAERPVEVQRVASAELLWPPPKPQRASGVAPLAGAVELVQRAIGEETAPTPAVQRVVHGHPALGAPVMPQPAREASSVMPTRETSQSTAVQARTEGEALSWSLEDSFQPAEAVRSVPLQRMFGEEVVQTAEEALPPPQAVPQATVEAKKPTVSAAEVEELAKRLYEPLTAKLKAELWLDRERAGRVSDRW